MDLNYIVLGTNNLQAAKAFYDALFEGAEIAPLFATDRMYYWQGKTFTFAIATPFDGGPATHGNGAMLGINMDTPAEVKRLHAKVLELGGTCEGPPNQRGPMYSAYVRDLDQNKISFYCYVAE